MAHSAHSAEGPPVTGEQHLGEPYTAPPCSDSQLLLEALLFCGMAQREAEEAAQGKVSEAGGCERTAAVWVPGLMGSTWA